MAEVLEESRTTLTVAIGERVPEDARLSPPEFDGQYDPHIWFDVGLWMNATEAVRDALIDLDPEHAEVFERNAAEYLAALEELDRYVDEQAHLVPDEQRILVTAHDAFNYFGRAYDVEVRGLQGISTASEAGTGDVGDLADFIAENRVPAIFVESSVPARTVEAVQAAVRAQGFDVAIGGELFADAMGDDGTFEGTYIGMVTHNIDTIVAALTGEGSE
jgi:manganese/zinc/iron transport system substrate-binding protein